MYSHRITYNRILIHDAPFNCCGIYDVRAIVVEYSKLFLRHRFHMVVLRDETCFFLVLTLNSFRLNSVHLLYAPLLSICETPNCFFGPYEMHGRCYRHFGRLSSNPSPKKKKDQNEICLLSHISNHK